MLKKMLLNFLQNITAPKIVTIIGGGGKTSLMYQLLTLWQEDGGWGIATTTTKLSSQYRSNHSFFTAQSVSEARQGIIKGKDNTEQITLVTGKQDQGEGKMLGIPSEWINTLANQYPDTLLIVEGDGSAGRSLKGHLPHEPVIPTESSLVIAVIGIDCLQKPIDSHYVQRPQRICELLDEEPSSLVTPELVTGLLFHPQGYLQYCPAHSIIIPFINKVEVAKEIKLAKELAKQIITAKHPQIPGVIIGSVFKQETLWLAQSY